MARRMAATLSLIVFAFCLLAGINAGNTLTTTLVRALEAMAGTLFVGLFIGVLARKMLDENVKQLKAAEKQPAAPQQANQKNLPAKEAKIAGSDR